MYLQMGWVDLKFKWAVYFWFLFGGYLNEFILYKQANCLDIIEQISWIRILYGAGIIIVIKECGLLCV